MAITDLMRGCLIGYFCCWVIADSNCEGIDCCSRILGSWAHFYSFETEIIPYGLSVVVMLTVVTKIGSEVIGCKCYVCDRGTSRW